MMMKFFLILTESTTDETSHASTPLLWQIISNANQIINLSPSSPFSFLHMMTRTSNNDDREEELVEWTIRKEK